MDFVIDMSKVRIFGSCVKDSANTMSDIDVLIITKERLIDRIEREILCEYISEVTEKFGVAADVIFYSEDEYK